MSEFEPANTLGNVVLKQDLYGKTAVPAPPVMIKSTSCLAVNLDNTTLFVTKEYFVFRFDMRIVH